MCSEFVFDHLHSIILNLSVLVNAVEQELGTQVGCHYNNCVLEIDRSALAVRDMTVVKDLKQHVKYIGMRFFDFIEEDHGERLSADCFCQLAALIVSHISGRCSDQAGYGEFLHVFAHIDTHHVVLVVKKVISQRLREFRLADACRTEEQEGTDRSLRILDSGLGTKNCVGYLTDRLILADHSLVKFILKIQDFFPLPFCQFADRDACPLGYDSADLIVRHFLMDHGMILVLHTGLCFGHFLLELRQLAVLKLCRFLKIVFSLCDLDL